MGSSSFFATVVGPSCLAKRPRRTRDPLGRGAAHGALLLRRGAAEGATAAVSFGSEIHVLYRDVYDNLSDAYWTGTTWQSIVLI